MKIIIMFLFVDDLIFGLGVVNICLYFLILNVIVCIYLNKNIEGEIIEY